jgi:hypothetical protein
MCISLYRALNAQNESDVLNLSQYFTEEQPWNFFEWAFGALGGDQTSLSTIRWFRRLRSSEFVFTPSLSFTNTKSDYNDYSYKDRNTKLGIAIWDLLFRQIQVTMLVG